MLFLQHVNSFVNTVAARRDALAIEIYDILSIPSLFMRGHTKYSDDQGTAMLWSFTYIFAVRLDN